MMIKCSIFDWLLGRPGEVLGVCGLWTDPLNDMTPHGAVRRVSGAGGPGKYKAAPLV